MALREGRRFMLFPVYALRANRTKTPGQGGNNLNRLLLFYGRRQGEEGSCLV